MPETSVGSDNPLQCRDPLCSIKGPHRLTDKCDQCRDDAPTASDSVKSSDAEIVERLNPEAINLRSVAQFERKQGRTELAAVIESAADSIERLSSDLESATKSHRAHSVTVVSQHAEITRLTARVEELEQGLAGAMEEREAEAAAATVAVLR